MVSFKLVIGNKDGTCAQKELGEPQALQLIGKKVHDKVDGSALGFEGYEFEVSGGSDNCGFPMRHDVPGTLRKRILAGSGTGVRPIDKGIHVRKTVAANTIHSNTVQVNLKVVKEGKEKIVAPPKEKSA
jgi:small subunit ribosomal protein S6e